MFELTGKTFIVTGGNGGLGFWIASGLAKAGANVAIWARNTEKNAKAVTELRKLGANVEAFVCNITSEDEIANAFQQTLERFDTVDGCFANAGYEGKAGLLHELDIQDWHDVFAVNVVGVVMVLKILAKYLIERGEGGKLLITSSIGAKIAGPNRVAYCASKAAVNSIAQSMARELGPAKIQVNTIAPGYFEAGMNRRVDNPEEVRQYVLNNISSDFLGQREHMEGTAVFFASDKSDFITGATIPVDGGYY